MIPQMNHPKSERQVNHGNTVYMNLVHFDNYRGWITQYANETYENVIRYFFSEKVDFELIIEYENKNAIVQGFVLQRVKREKEREN